MRRISPNLARKIPHDTKNGGDMTYRAGAGLILLAGLIWSTQGLGVRLIAEAEAWTIMTWRSIGLIVALAVFLHLRTKGQLWAALRGIDRFGLMGAMSLVLAFGGAIYAMQTTSIANAVVLFTAAPFFAAIIGRLALGEPVPWVTWVAIALAMLGIAVMVGGQIDMRDIWGNVAALLSAFGFGGFSVALRRTGGGKRADGDVGHFPIVLLAGLFSAGFGLALCQVTGQTLLPPAGDIGMALFMGAGTLAGGMILYTFGTRTVPAAAATLLSQVEVILGPFWVWLILGEQISRATALGGSVVLVALILNVVGNSRKASLQKV
jgi:drug/metabolite transporter (DMT)-like permease